MQRLYELGARRVLVTGTGPLGCVPAELAMQGSVNGECAPEPQRAANLFNPALVRMTQQLNQEIGSDVFAAVNAFRMSMDFVSDPQRFGMYRVDNNAVRFRIENLAVPNREPFVQLSVPVVNNSSSY